MGDRRLKLAYAGDRDVSVRVLDQLIELGDRPDALVLPDEDRASHDGALLSLCRTAGCWPVVLRAGQLKNAAAIERLQRLELDYIICVHFPYILRQPVLDAARAGVLNLHPAYLPYNRGWHTPTWSILEDTPAGASLHYVSEALDGGDVVYQEQVATNPADTAHTLYLKVKDLEVSVFREGWRRVRQGGRAGRPQDSAGSTLHRRQDLFDPAVQRIDLDEVVRTGDLLRRLRALTTSRLDEAAYFETSECKYRVQVTITPVRTL
jgi:methionyl-tRNA formyltransferase